MLRGFDFPGAATGWPQPRRNPQRGPHSTGRWPHPLGCLMSSLFSFPRSHPARSWAPRVPGRASAGFKEVLSVTRQRSMGRTCSHGRPLLIRHFPPADTPALTSSSVVATELGSQRLAPGLGHSHVEPARPAVAWFCSSHQRESLTQPQCDRPVLTPGAWWAGVGVSHE